MNVKFSDIKRDSYGRIEKPVMLLKTRYGKRVGVLGKYSDLKLELKFNEVSKLTFEVPAHSHSEATPFYDMICGEAMIQLEPFGPFIIQEPKTTGNGIREVKRCTAYSLEHELTGKQLSFAEGTYPFWNPVAPKGTILGIALERAKSWAVGSVSPTLYNRYRTFDQTDTNVLDFLLGTAQETYGCVFVFDTHNRVINVVDAKEDTRQLPIYMSYQNLLKEVNVTERNDKYANRVSVSGADGVDIRNVNPTGTNEIIHLGHPISMGAIPDVLTEKYYDWKRAIIAQQAYYTGLVALRNATYARYLTEKARLTDLEAELTSLDNLRSVNVQGRAMATEYGSEAQEGTIAYFDARLVEIATQYTAKEKDIQEQKALLESIQADYDATNGDIKAVNDRLRFESYFTSDELLMLDPYMRDGFLSDSSFATFDVDVSGTNDSFTKGKRVMLQFKDVSVTDIEMTNTWACANHHSFAHTGTPDACPTCGSTSLNRTSGSDRRIWAIGGGDISVSGDGYSLSAPIISGTLDYDSGTSEAVFSAYLGSGRIGEDKFPSGNLSCAFTASMDMDALLGGMEKKVETVTDKETGVSREDITYKGDCTMTAKDTALYFTRNVTEYQRYSVEQELYDFAESRMEEIAYPVYEFSVQSGNFIWDERFEPFKNALQLGSAVYLKLDEKTALKPVLLEVHLDYEKPDNFSLVFSSQYQTKRPDRVNKMKDIIKDAQSTSRTLDLGKLGYRGQNISGATAAFDQFMKTGLNTAYQQVTAGLEQEVKINEAGIKVGTRGKSEFIYLSNGMISIVDEATKSSKMAMGHFYSQEYGQDYYGIIADVIVGTLVAGHGFSFACQDINDGSMLFEANSKGVQLHNSRFYLDHDRGGQIVLDPVYGFALGTKDLYTFDENGHCVLNYDNANAYINIDGRLVIQDGISKGDFYANNFYFNDGESVKTLLDQASKKFDLSELDYIDLGGIQLDGVNSNINFNGAGSITWGKNAPTKKEFSVSATGPWHDDMQSADKWRRDWDYYRDEWGVPYQFRGEDGKPGANGNDASVTFDNVLKALQKASSTKSTFITADEVGAPSIYGGKIYGAEMYANEFSVFPLDETEYTGAFNLHGMYNKKPYHFLQISYADSGFGTPEISFESPGGATSRWMFSNTYFNGNVQFGGAISLRSAKITDWGDNLPTLVLA